MMTEISHSLERAFSQQRKSTAPGAALEVPRFASEFGGRLVALSGAVGLDGLVSRAEMLSPLLAGLAAGERLGLEIALMQPAGAPVVGLRGVALGVSAAEAEARRLELSDLLGALMRGQLPGFVFRPLEARDALPTSLVHEIILKPRGRATGEERASTREPRPQLVAQEAADIVLPAMSFCAERLTTAIELLRACGEPAVMRLDFRLVTFDAAALRRLAASRDAASHAEPRSTVEAMRHLVECVPDDALMSALLNEGGGVELTLTIRTAERLDAARRHMLCYAVFGTSPADAVAASALDLSSTFPRSLMLSRAIGGLAAAAVLALRRRIAVYAPPGSPCVLLGHTCDGRSVAITEADRALHTFVVGATGTGKSTLVLNQIVADMRAGKGLIVIDPHGDLWEGVRQLVPKHREKDVVLAHLSDARYPFTMNVLAGLGGDPAIERSGTVNGLIRLLKNSLWPDVKDAFGPMFELYFRNAMMLLMEAEGDKATIRGFERLFQDDEYRDSLIALCKSQNTIDFWRKTVDRISHHEISLENVAPYIICKFAPFTTNKLLAPVLGASSSSLDLKAAIADGKIVLVNLAKGVVGEGSARLVGALITMRLVAAAQTQMTLPQADRKTFVAYLDEFQTYATEHVAEAIEETRKYKLRLVLACQSLGQIDGKGHRPDVGASILANVANLVSFRLGVDDAQILARWFEPMFRAEDLMYLPNRTAVGRLLVDGQASRPVEFSTPPPPATCCDGVEAGPTLTRKIARAVPAVGSRN